MLPIESIMKYIMSVYKPSDVEIGKFIIGDKSLIRLTLYFEKIDEKYLKNPYSRDPVDNKEINFETEIRRDVEMFFSIKTTGLTIVNDLNGPSLTAPFAVGDLDITVKSNEPEYYF